MAKREETKPLTKVNLEQMRTLNARVKALKTAMEEGRKAITQGKKAVAEARQELVQVKAKRQALMKS